MRTPANFSLCMASADVCPLAETCLRHKAWAQMSEQPDKENSVLIVNPLSTNNDYATDHCKAYRTAEKQRYAIGMTHLYDNVRPHLRKWVRDTVKNTFTSERTYYYCRNGQFRITPEMQQRIAEAFRQCEQTAEPQFDRYIYDHDWY